MQPPPLPTIPANAIAPENTAQAAPDSGLTVVAWLYFLVSLVPALGCAAALILSHGGEEAAPWLLLMAPLSLLLGVAGIVLGACSRLGASWLCWWGTVIALSPFLLVMVLAIVAALGRLSGAI